MEAEVREILAAVVKLSSRVRMGDALAAIGRKIGLSNEDFAVLENVRDKTPAKPWHHATPRPMKRPE